MFWDDLGIPWVMALKRKVDDVGDEDDKEQGEPTAKRSKGPGKGGPSVIAVTSMMKEKRLCRNGKSGWRRWKKRDDQRSEERESLGRRVEIALDKDRSGM